MQRGDYEKKKAAMRARAKTPHAKALKKITQARWVAKRSEMQREKAGKFVMTVKPQALLQALALWR